MRLIYGVIEIKGISFLMFSIFSVSVLGYLLGRIRIKGVGLGTAGVFILSLVYGALFSDHLSSTVVQSSSGKQIDISANALKIVENTGLIFFIGAVGFISGPGFFKNLKKNFKSYIILGLIIILSSTITCIICFYIGRSSESDKKEFVAMLVGIFSGALTSTPAFSAAKATTDTQYESAVTVGHGIAYLYGVIGVVLFVQLSPKILKANIEYEKKLLTGEEVKPMDVCKTEGHQDINGSKVEYEHGIATTEQGDSSSRPHNIQNEKEKTKEEKVGKEHIDEKHQKENILTINQESKDEKIKKDDKEDSNEKKQTNHNLEEHKGEIEKEPTFIIDSFGLCVFSVGAIVGIFFGAIKIPLSNKGLDGTTFSFTTTGGVLIISLVISHFGRIGQLSLKVEKKVLEVLRELGLFLFLVGTGISGGAKFIDYFKVAYFFYGIFMTTVPLFVGFIFGKYVLKLCLLNNLGSITGGMTSTPALGTLINLCQCDEVGGSYAATYPISLITVVLSSQFMVLLLK